MHLKVNRQDQPLSSFMVGSGAGMVRSGNLNAQRTYPNLTSDIDIFDRVEAIAFSRNNNESKQARKIPLLMTIRRSSLIFWLAQ